VRRSLKEGNPTLSLLPAFPEKKGADERRIAFRREGSKPLAV
jgi:hypothetical protein